MYPCKQYQSSSKTVLKQRFGFIKNQFRRRNLIPFQRAELALELKPLIEDVAKENQSIGGGDKKSENAKSGSRNSDKAIKKMRTDVEIGKQAGVSKDTIRAVEFIKEHGSGKQIKEVRNVEK